MPPDRIVFCFGVSSFYGWGVIGLNLMLHWPCEALCALPDMDGQLADGDPRIGKLREQIEASRLMSASPKTLFDMTRESPVIHALGNNLMRALPGEFGKERIAWVVFEDADQVRTSILALTGYDQVWCASRWNCEVLREMGVSCVKLVHQGADLAYFNHTVRQKRTDGRFRVFSGGKCEHRKGQDIVLQAFSRFAEKHDDAVLVAAWSSPWPGLAREFADSPVGSVPGAEIGMPNFAAWAQRAGIRPHQIEIVTRRANCEMPQVYGSVDCAIFPSRAEGGTNLVAMEAMACGVPAILSDETGHRDLQGYAETLWCDRRFDEQPFVSALESYYAGYRAYRDEAPPMDYWDWPSRVQRMREVMNGE